MTDVDFIEFDSTGRMIDFNEAHSDLFKNNTLLVSLFVLLNADVAILETAGASRVSSKGLRSDGTTDKEAARIDLYALVRKIIENAKLIKKNDPDFDNVFKIRRGTLSTQELLDAARAFAENLTAPVAQKFADLSLLTATAANVNTKIDVLEAAGTHQNQGRASGVAATATTRAAIKRLKKNRRTAAQIGENIIEADDDAGLLAEWESACRIARREKKNTPPKP
jgi:hypothetical protein